jgi:hypothetical protein
MRSVLRRLQSATADGTPSSDFPQTDEIVLIVDYAAPEGCSLAGTGFSIATPEGLRVGAFNTYMSAPPPHSLPASGRATFRLAAAQLTPGSYYVSVSIGSHPGVLEDKVDNALSFTVHPADIYGTGYLLTREDGVAAFTVCADVQATSGGVPADRSGATL